MASSCESTSSDESLATSGGGASLGINCPLRGQADTIKSGPEVVTKTCPSPANMDAELEPKTVSGLLDARAYQREMYEASMQRNIILAMDTGTGKTQVAVLRIKAELDRTPHDKIVWFLAPTVQLCNQQSDVLRTQIPAVQIKLLLGEDNIQAWSNSTTWDAALLNVRVVVSTPQILLDALGHAFFSMERLSLLVFDEAHNSVKNNSSSRIMQDFYHPKKASGMHVPHILGLTASPIMNSNIDGLETLERTLDAVCRSPFVHRAELRAHVRKPQLGHALYSQSWPFQETQSLRSLLSAFRNVDITKDPSILHLKAQANDRSRRELATALLEHDTWAQKQLTALCQRAKRMLHDLGPWACDLYISRTIDAFSAVVATRDLWSDDWKEAEKQYLLAIFGDVCYTQPRADNLGSHTVTEKVSCLMKQLLQTEDSTVCLVFVRERTTASILAEVIASHPVAQKKYPKVGVMAGTSQSSARKRDVWDLFRGGDQSLEQFRTGNLNLLITTSVLEEGIDVPSCNLVICFDKPSNLKSFIQIRGRAREKNSRLIVLLDSVAPERTEWEYLEALMKQQYEDQDRELKKLEETEESEESSTEAYLVDATEARLDHDNAKSHLSHFCSILCPGPFIDNRPDYITLPVDDADPPTLETTVYLPSYIPVAVRRAKSGKSWKSVKNSTKDAAFQAYVALHKAGLVNDHLLPLQAEDLMPPLERRPALMQVNGLLNVWLEVSRAWQRDDDVWSTTISLTNPQGAVSGEYELYLPVRLPQIPSTPVYYSRNDVWNLDFGPLKPTRRPVKDHVAALLALSFQHRWTCENRQQPIVLTCRGEDIDASQLGAKQLEAIEDIGDSVGKFLVRDRYSCPYVLEGVIPSKPEKELVQKVFREDPETPGFEDAPDDVPYLTMKSWPRRTDYLHQPNSDSSAATRSVKQYARVYPLTWARLDAIPASHAQFSLLIPSILHHVEVRILAARLSESLLQNIAISDLSLVQTAISAPVAREPTNYERLELLGDTVLKLCTTTNVAALHPHLPEGYLSVKKDGIVSNSRLCRAALKHGLDKFILTKAFTGHRWRPKYVDDILQEMQSESDLRVLSSKTLADVVEALIGAAYYDGGLPKALACIRLFIGGQEWMPLEAGRQAIYDAAPEGEPLPTSLKPLEDLLNYTFKKKSLLVEATTHASFNSGSASGCLERLEFLGDAVLDYIVVKHVFSVPNLSQNDLHLLKTATVNGDLLAFMCLEHYVEQQGMKIVPTGNASEPMLEPATFRQSIWKFMRYNNPDMGAEQKAMEERHDALRGPILEALYHGKKFPWALLSRLRAKKFYSDLLEAIIGAVWVDSGDMTACVEVVKTFGIMRLLERLIKDRVHLLHPKQELGMMVDCSTVTYKHYQTEEVGGTARCRLMIGDRSIVDFEAGDSKLETETLAAEAALKILQNEQQTV